MYLFSHPNSLSLGGHWSRSPCSWPYINRDHKMCCLRRINSWAPPHPNASTPTPLAKHTMAPPSSFVISGIFSLSEGIRSTEQRHYVDYLSAIDFVDPNDFLNVSVRKYTALAEPLHEDHALVFMVTKGALPVADSEGMLDTIYCAPFESSSVDNTTHVAHVAGTVTSVSNNDMTTRSFTLSVTEYVRGERRTFPVMFVCALIPNLIPFPLIRQASRIQYEGTSN